MIPLGRMDHVNKSKAPAVQYSVLQKRKVSFGGKGLRGSKLGKR